MQAITTILTGQHMQGIETKILTEEDKLILAAQANRDKFQPLYEKYYTQILKFVYQRVTTKDDAYDITQQVFLQAMLSLNKYELRGFPFSSWLYRIAINELNQAFRKNEKQRGVNLEEKHLKDIVEEMNEGGVEEKESILLDALTGLDEEDFQLVEMRFFEKRAFKEIGEILSITEANAKMKLYRILDKLKPILEKKMAL
ncbi:MAG TPA: sigma-70 family RNA polymerase sigma factor [Chitinophagales bacterium]|nr:sigma-70 family RNA polymerase sigma factor [Chitinophagales bacterium]